MNLSRYIKTFKNWPTIFFNVSRKNFNFNVKYRDGRILPAISQAYLYLLSFSPKNLNYDQLDDIINFDFNGKQVKMKGGLNNGDLGSIFGEECYDVEVEGKVVLDIGANIGDSSIFFALKGASKVIAFEPMPANYITLEQNIALNSLQNIIVPMRNGVSATKKIVHLPGKVLGTTINASTMETYSGKEEIEFMDLSEVVLSIRPHVLKIDCEGCEFEIFRSVSQGVLQMIEIIVGEYHDNGFRELKQIFENAGFVCKYKKTRISTGLFIARRSI